MFFRNWQRSFRIQDNSRIARRQRRKFQPKIQSLEQRSLLSVTPAPVTIAPVETQAFTGTVATFTATDAGPFSATVDWGDGTTDAGTVAANSSGGFDVTGTHIYAEDGTEPVTVAIIDSADSTTATAISTANISEGSFVLSGTAPITATEGVALTGLQVATFQDPGSSDPASAFTATVDWGDGTTDAGTVTGADGVFTVTGSHTYADEMSGNISVTVAEPAANFTIGPNPDSVTVTDADSGTVTAQAIAATEGHTFSGQVATLSDTYTGQVASDLTATINWGDGTTDTGTVSGSGGNFTISGSHAYTDEGVYTVTTTVADDAPGTFTATGTATATIAEGDSGTLTPTTITRTEGQAFSGAVATFTDEGNPLQVASDWTASINWGDGTVTAGTVTGSTGGPFTISGSHTYGDDGSYSVVATFSDDPPSTLTNIAITSTAVISEADLTVTAGPAITASEGQVLTGVQVATFSDPGSPDAATNYAAIIDWGDGTTSTGTVSGSAGNFTVNADHTYADELNGTYTVTVSEVDANFTATPVTNSVTIGEGDSGSLNPATITPTEGTQFSGAVATFTDNYAGQVASDFSSSIDWGDGTTTTGTVSGPTGGPFTISGNHTYADEGTFTVLASFADDAPSTLTATITSTANVAEGDTLVAGTAVTASATEGATFTGTVATFSDTTYAANLPSDFTAAIEWGDGTTSTGTVTGAAGSFTVSGSHLYAEEGTKTATVVLSDDAPGTATGTSAATINVADATLSATGTTINGTEGYSVTAVVANFTDADPAGTASDYTATIDWGDGTTSAGTIAAAGSGFQVSGSHTFAEDGSYSITVSIADVGGSKATASGTASIAEPVISATAVPVRGVERSSSEVAVATFTHGNGAESAASFAAIINWGDGTTSSALVSESGGIYTISGSHAYLDEGIYPVIAAVSDDTASATVGTVAKIGEELLPNGTTGTANQRFISEVFRDLFHRQVDQGGLDFWSGLLDQGQSRLQVVSQIIATSMPGELGADLVTGMYQKYLGRTPDAQGLAFWVGIVSQKETIEDTQANLVSTPEFFALSGGTNEGYITRLFNLALGRAPDPQGMSNLLSDLSNGFTREQVAEAVFNSHEFHQLEVAGYYQSQVDPNDRDDTIVPFIDDLDFLDRPADAGGLAAYTAQLDAGVLDQVVWAQFLASDEFFAKTA